MSIIHRSLEGIFTQEEVFAKRPGLHFDNPYRAAGFRSPQNKPYQPIGQMADVDELYSEIRKTYHLPGRYTKDETEYTQEFKDTFYSSNLRPKSKTHKRIVQNLRDNSADKLLGIQTMNSNSTTNNQIQQMLLRAQQEAENIDYDHLKKQKNPYTLKLKKEDPINNKSRKELKNLVSHSDSNVKKVRAGTTLASFFKPKRDSIQVTGASFYKRDTSQNSRVLTTSMSSTLFSSQRGVNLKIKTILPDKKVSPMLMIENSPPKKSPKKFNTFRTSTMHSRSRYTENQPSPTSQTRDSVYNPVFMTEQEAGIKSPKSPKSPKFEQKSEKAQMNQTHHLFRMETIEQVKGRLSVKGKIPFISVQSLDKSLQENELKRIRKPISNPMSSYKHKLPLKIRLRHQFQDYETAAQKKKDDQRRKTKLYQKPDEIFQKTEDTDKNILARIREVLGDEEGFLLKTLSSVRIKFIKIIKKIIQKNRVVKGFQSEIEAKKRKRILDLQDRFDELSDKKVENSKYLTFQLTAIGLNRKNLIGEKFSNLKTNLSIPSRTFTHFIRDNKRSTKRVLESNVPVDIKWYEEILNELSVENYPLNKGVTLLFEQIKYFLERGVCISHKIFMEILDNIDPNFFQNSTMIYLLRRICKFIEMNPKEVLEYFISKKNFKLVNKIEGYLLHDTTITSNRSKANSSSIHS